MSPRKSREAIDEKTWNEIADQIRDAIRSSVVPAYRKFAEFLKQEYLPACRGPIGAAAMPGGREFYRDRVWTIHNH